MIVRIKGIKRVRSKGHVYYYHRTTGKRLNAPPWSAAFIDEARRLDAAPATDTAAKPRHQSGAVPHKAGSWGALVAAYRASPEFARLAARTKSDYGKVLDYLSALDDMPLAQMTPAFCLQARDLAFAQHKRRFANYVVHMLSAVFGWGRPRGHVAENAAAGVKRIAAPRGTAKQNRAWSDEECAAVLSSATGALRVAVALGMYAGMRGGDVVRIGWSAYDGSAVEWRQGKTGDAVWMPAHRHLREILDSAPRIATTIVAGIRGRPWASITLRCEFRKLILRLERSGAVEPGLTFHGLRSTAAVMLADVGADVRAIQALLGHRTAREALHYSEEADRRRAATTAVRALENRTANKRRFSTNGA